MIKTFKGLIAHNTTQKIRLSTNNGLTGYNITKFQVFPAGAQNSGGFNYTYKAALGIYSVEREPQVPGSTNNYRMINFESPTLLAAGFYSMNSSADTNPEELFIVIDNKVINQDVFLTYFNVGGGDVPINYYIELEQVKLDLNEATVATLKDIRGRE
jgi:hypothetical protein